MLFQRFIAPLTPLRATFINTWVCQIVSVRNVARWRRGEAQSKAGTLRGGCNETLSIVTLSVHDKPTYRGRKEMLLPLRLHSATGRLRHRGKTSTVNCRHNSEEPQVRVPRGETHDLTKLGPPSPADIKPSKTTRRKEPGSLTDGEGTEDAKEEEGRSRLM
ncbi:hypothetical protein E2C01_069174 [Portunus trituberculatus]|uniref:Uncharacterized protein n=1 Tax=Portunus trituberculatus TaxID=210409 RepID=A0A5B7HQR4_PORTR|nr:hypothetical protein [Portunus trituberculatus]